PGPVVIQSPPPSPKITSFPPWSAQITSDRGVPRMTSFPGVPLIVQGRNGTAAADGAPAMKTKGARSATVPMRARTTRTNPTLRPGPRSGAPVGRNPQPDESSGLGELQLARVRRERESQVAPVDLVRADAREQRRELGPLRGRPAVRQRRRAGL